MLTNSPPRVALSSDGEISDHVNNSLDLPIEKSPEILEHVREKKKRKEKQETFVNIKEKSKYKRKKNYIHIILNP